jgi:hypothetical protein
VRKLQPNLSKSKIFMMKKMTRWRMFANFVMLVITRRRTRCLNASILVLLLAGGCQTSQRGYFDQGVTGNAWAITLPKGTKLSTSGAAVLGPAFEEVKDGVLVEECVLVSKQYLHERDNREIEQLYMIQELKTRKDVP